MGTVTLIRVSASALRRNGQRTLLAALAVAIGIAAVIATAAIGNGSAARIERQIGAVGDDFLWIRAGNRNVGGVRSGSGSARTMRVEDASALVNQVPEIVRCSPRVTGRAQIIVGRANWNTTYRGVSSDFFDIRRRRVMAGVPFAPFDEAAHARVIVAGPAVAARLFGDADPIGQTVRMAGGLYRIIGVLESKGIGTGGLDRDDAVYLPITTARRSLERQPWIDDIMCSVSSPEMTSFAEAQAAGLLRERHRISPDEPNDFEVQKPIETLELRAGATRTLRVLLPAIGAVSLLVGGIGIMNVMLVCVTERRREIGIRLAIGAHVRDIRRQFLLEAAGIGLAGGVTGVALGIGAAHVLAARLGTEAMIAGDLVGWVTAAALGAGLLFGYLPARRASTLDPLEAVLSES